MRERLNQQSRSRFRPLAGSMHSPNRLLPWLCVAWPIGLGLTVGCNSSVVVDPTALVRFSQTMDSMASSWATAAFGYVGILATASHLKQHRGAGLGPTASITWSVLSLCSYTFHLLLLRWPWMSGVVEPGSRLTQWSGALSATHWGVPWSAFVELLCISILLVHARAGLVSVAAGFSARLRERAAMLSMWVCSGLCFQASWIVIALATGRR